jgi:hypothetical protein
VEPPTLKVRLPAGNRNVLRNPGTVTIVIWSLTIRKLSLESAYAVFASVEVTGE